MIDFDTLVAPKGVGPAPDQSRPPHEAWNSGPPVLMSADVRRVLALPYRELELDGTERAEAIIDTETARVSRNTKRCRCAQIDPERHRDEGCIARLRLVQALALREIAICGGLLGPIGVGHGKTLIDWLAAFAFQRASANYNKFVLLVPPGLVAQLLSDYRYIGQHFQMPQAIFHGHPYVNTLIKMDHEVPLERGAPEVHVVPYSRLSRPEATAWLETALRPDGIIADEAHKLRNVKTATGSRVKRWMDDHPATRFAGWSGSITSKKIQDYAHLAAWALRGGSPLPLDPETTDDWGRALNPTNNPDRDPAEPGPLLKLCNPGEPLLDAWRRRVIGTLGVVTTNAPATDCELELYEAKAPVIPETVREALRLVRGEVPDKTAQRPDGEELVDALAMARVATQIACGFYYKWIYPRCEFPRDTQLVLDWLEARKEWFCEVRGKLKRLGEHMDSPRLVQNAAERFYGDRPRHKGLPEWRSEHWPRWRDIRGQVYYETEVVWVDDYLVRDVITRMRAQPMIVWYEHGAFGERVCQDSGLPMFGGGKDAKLALLGDAARGIPGEDGSRSVLCSIKAMGTGTNGLQHRFHEAMIPVPMSMPDGWEQCLDAETEILTSTGWKGIDDQWGDDTRAAAYDIADGSVQWEDARRVERHLGGEAMWGVSSPHLDLRVTAGHRMVIEPARHATRSTVVYDERRFVAASDMPNVGRIPLAGVQQADGVALSTDELRFLGLFLTDGNLDPSNNTVALFQSDRYPEIVSEIERILGALGFHARHSTNDKPSNFGTRNHTLHKWVISYTTKQVGKRGWAHLAPFVDKDFTPLFEACSRDQLLELLYGMWLGDGQKTPGTYAYDRYTSHTISIVTKRGAVADRIQSLCVRRGMRCNVSRGRIHTLHISPEDAVWHVRRRAADSRPVWAAVPAEPHERVWCASVPTGAIIVRRNGKVAVVGNCLGRLHRLGQKAERVRYGFYRHTPEMRRAVDAALNAALYVEGIHGAQKIRQGFDFSGLE